MAPPVEPPASLGELGLTEALVELSRSFGADPELVIGGGGNTSVKFDDHILVKASGAALASIGPEGFVDLDRRALEALLGTDLGESRDQREAGFKEAVLAARREPSRLQRPSIESLLHHVMPGTFVVHLHATLVNQFGCCREGPALIERHLGDEVVWVRLVDPGFALAKELQRQLGAFEHRTGRERPRAVILQGHGLVVSGDTPREVAEHLEWLFHALRDIQARASVRPTSLHGQHPLSGVEASELEVGARQALADALSLADDHKRVIEFDNSPAVVDFVTGGDGYDIAMGGPVMPDQVVYCRSFPVWVTTLPGEPISDLEGRLRVAVEVYTDRHHVQPSIVLLERLGLFAVAGTSSEAGTARLVYVDAIKVMTGALKMGGINYLEEGFRNFIENWEAQSYRRSVSARPIRLS